MWPSKYILEVLIWHISDVSVRSVLGFLEECWPAPFLGGGTFEDKLTEPNGQTWNFHGLQIWLEPHTRGFPSQWCRFKLCHSLMLTAGLEGGVVMFCPQRFIANKSDRSTNKSDHSHRHLRWTPLMRRGRHDSGKRKCSENAIVKLVCPKITYSFLWIRGVDHHHVVPNFFIPFCGCTKKLLVCKAGVLFFFQYVYLYMLIPATFLIFYRETPQLRMLHDESFQVPIKSRFSCKQYKYTCVTSSAIPATKSYIIIYNLSDMPLEQTPSATPLYTNQKFSLDSVHLVAGPIPSWWSECHLLLHPSHCPWPNCPRRSGRKMWGKSWRLWTSVSESKMLILHPFWRRLNWLARWWFQILFYFHLYLGKISSLTNIFQMGWFNHQPDWRIVLMLVFNHLSSGRWSLQIDLVGLEAPWPMGFIKVDCFRSWLIYAYMCPYLAIRSLTLKTSQFID